ncbi:anti-sigma factor [Paenibacillus sp. JX-17]|uniref:Anti-sigma factor n=1 Tax=Paenibacillus lacisoli TaxID=3064525 RepID=A0ABT9CBI9_9BACL|nr:anti-sigma factor [Paenibacillus sp. JX-17]MDO7905051.1 anti-sigma factor [Paenibacillus sp. JX-17]
MKCREAKEVFGLLEELPEHDLRRIRAKRHVEQCPVCSSEQEEWEELRLLMMSIPDEVTDAQAEAVNRNVMNRIYAESPWLVPGEVKQTRVPPVIRSHLRLWIAAFVALFLCSFIYWMTDQPVAHEQAADSAAAQHETVQATGILPTGIAGSPQTAEQFNYNIPVPKNGITDPLVVSMAPAYPQYWMALSLLALCLAIVSIRWVHRVRRT